MCMFIIVHARLNKLRTIWHAIPIWQFAARETEDKIKHITTSSYPRNHRTTTTLSAKDQITSQASGSTSACRSYKSPNCCPYLLNQTSKRILGHACLIPVHVISGWKRSMKYRRAAYGRASAERSTASRGDNSTHFIIFLEKFVRINTLMNIETSDTHCLCIRAARKLFS